MFIGLVSELLPRLIVAVWPVAIPVGGAVVASALAVIVAVTFAPLPVRRRPARLSAR